MPRQTGNVPHALLGGLSTREATDRLRAFGPNLIAVESLFQKIKERVIEFADPMALMLAVGSGAYFWLGESTEATVLLCALIPVLAVDVVLEARSRSALGKLAQAVSPSAFVLRDGAEVEIKTAEIVPGDIMLVSEGGVVHGDGVVRIAANLSVDESQLTGEAEPQNKTALAPEKEAGQAGADCRVYTGSRVLAGHGWVEVTATGARTSYGNLAELVAQTALRPTPLQEKTGRFVRWLIVSALLLSTTLFVVRTARGARIEQAFLSALSLGISAVGEEFLIVMTTFLSLGAWRLSRSGILVRRLACVETLGETGVVCVDKTGTLTVGQFAVATLRPTKGISEQHLAEAALLACEPAAADAIERAIVNYADSSGIDHLATYSSWELMRDHPFDPIGKHMSHVWHQRVGAAAGRELVVAKGSLEGLLEHCDLSDAEKADVEADNNELAFKGIRVLAVAEREAEAGAATRESDESGLKILGLIGFSDPIRPQVKAAIEECQSAGVRVKLITGDHVLTAHAVADASAIAHEESGIITGPQLDSFSKEQFDEALRRGSVFARVRPEQKYAIVDALKRSGEVVAMTGDGINDTPAMRRADVAISMGRRATEVARSVADLVLLQDDFSAIPVAIREGRQIYANIQRAFLYLIGFKSTLVLTALAVPLAGFPILLLPVHLVWLELIVHPVSALAFEDGSPLIDVMRVPPRDRAAPFIDLGSAFRSAACGVFLSIAAVGAYLHDLAGGENHARTMAIAIIIIGSLAMVAAEYLDPRSSRSPSVPRSLRFWLVIAGVALSLPVFMSVAPVAQLLMIAPISAKDWLLAFILGVMAVSWRFVGLKK